jgi:hypothetical protein
MVDVAAEWYGKALIKALNKEINIIADNIKVILVTDAYIPNQDTHEYKDDITNEITGGNYVAGGELLLNKSVTYDPSNNRIKLDSDDIIWTLLNANVRYGIIYDDTPNLPADKPLIGLVDFFETLNFNNEKLRLIWNPAGFLNINIS